MPAKAKSPARKSSTKAVAKAKPRRVVSRTAPSVTVSSRSVKKHSVWTKPHFMEPQEEFFAKHPNSKILLALFIGVLIFYFLLVWVNRVEMFPQLFAAY